MQPPRDGSSYIISNKSFMDIVIGYQTDSVYFKKLGWYSLSFGVVILGAKAALFGWSKWRARQIRHVLLRSLASLGCCTVQQCTHFVGTECSWYVFCIGMHRHQCVCWHLLKLVCVLHWNALPSMCMFVCRHSGLQGSIVWLVQTASTEDQASVFPLGSIGLCPVQSNNAHISSACIGIGICL